MKDDFPFFGLFVTLFCAIFFGVAGAFLVVDEIRAYRLGKGLKDAAVAVQDSLDQQKRARAAAVAKSAADRAAQDQVRAVLARQESERRKRKQQAWEAFYQPSPACRADSLSYGCADAHIRAKTAFEAQYRD